MFRKRTVSRATSSFSTTFSEENDSDVGNINDTETKPVRVSFMHRLTKKKTTKGITEEHVRLVVTDGITLQEILLDEELHIEFELFLATQHAVENLSLWQELVSFASHEPESRSEMPTRRPSSRRVSPTEVSELEPSEASTGRASGASSRRPSRRPSRRNTGGSSRRKSRMSRKQPSAFYPEAQRLFDVYMQPNAPCWVSLDDKNYRAVATVLEERPHLVQRDFFNDIQTMVFKNMQSDLVPRFIKQVLGRYPLSPANSNPSMMELEL